MTGRVKKSRAGGENVGDLHSAVNALVVHPADDEEVGLAVRCVNRWTAGTGTFDVLEMLGLPPLLVTVRRAAS